MFIDKFLGEIDLERDLRRDSGCLSVALAQAFKFKAVVVVRQQGVVKINVDGLNQAEKAFKFFFPKVGELSTTSLWDGVSARLLKPARSACSLPNGNTHKDTFPRLRNSTREHQKQQSGSVTQERCHHERQIIWSSLLCRSVIFPA